MVLVARSAERNGNGGSRHAEYSRIRRKPKAVTHQSVAHTEILVALVVIGDAGNGASARWSRWELSTVPGRESLFDDPRER